MDDVDSALDPRISFLWSPVGQQQTIPTPGKNHKRYLAGALHARMGRLDYVDGEPKNTALFLCVWEGLSRVCRSADPSF